MQIEGGYFTLTKGLQSTSMMVYHCPEGYYPYPVLARLCQADGTWKPARKRSQPEKCRREWRQDDVSQFAWDYIITRFLMFCFAVVECPDPNVLEYGDVSPPQEKYFVDNETTYECYSRYTMRGSSRRVCLPNGKWSGSTPICSRDSKSWAAACVFFLKPLSPLGLGCILIHDHFMTLSFLLQQQELPVPILVSQPVDREQGTSLTLTTKLNTPAMVTCSWLAQVKECVERTASGPALSQNVSVRVTSTYNHHTTTNLHPNCSFLLETLLSIFTCKTSTCWWTCL